jgi:hypothetical protein
MTEYLTPREEIRVSRKEVVIGGAGTRASYQVPLMARNLFRLGAFERLNSAWLLEAEPKEADVAAQKLEELSKRSKTVSDYIKGVEFRIFVSNLPGVTQYMHEPLMALKYLPMYEHRVLKQVKEHGEYISGRGGVSLFLFEATTGGHLTPELCYIVNLALQMPRPELVIASIARPVRTDVLASRNFRERMAHWANHNLQDMDGLLIVDNSATTKVRQLSEVDELVALAKAASLSTYRVRGQKHPLEIWKTLTMQGKLIGIKAMQIPASSLGAPRKFMGFNYGTSWRKHRGYITSAYIGGLRRLSRDPSCNLSNLPEAKQGGRIFFVIGPDEETFDPIKKHCELHYGLCQLCPGSAFDNEFYLLELFNIDEKALAKELEIEFKLDKKGNIQDGKTIEEVISVINDWAGVPGISDKIWR